MPSIACNYTKAMVNLFTSELSGMNVHAAATETNPNYELKHGLSVPVLKIKKFMKI